MRIGDACSALFSTWLHAAVETRARQSFFFLLQPTHWLAGSEDDTSSAPIFSGPIELSLAWRKVSSVEGYSLLQVPWWQLTMYSPVEEDQNVFFLGAWFGKTYRADAPGKKEIERSWPTDEINFKVERERGHYSWHCSLALNDWTHKWAPSFTTDWVEIWCSCAVMILFFFNKNHTSEFQKIFWRNILPQMLQKSISNTLYYELHKNE